MASGQATELPRLVALIKTLTIPQLKDLLRKEGLAVSGLKAALQMRIIDYLDRLCQSEGNSVRYDALRRRIIEVCLPGSHAFDPTPNPRFQNSPAAPQTSSQRRLTVGNSMSPHPHTSGPIVFKDSPFFTVIAPVTPIVECKVREQTRDSVELKIFLSQPDVARLERDSNIRVMIYCTADSGLKQFTKSDIAFPHQVELKANLDEVKANLRGLKNKPGTTQPADVTWYLRKKPNYPNNIVMTYALTQKVNLTHGKFFVLANMVKLHPVDELVSQLKSRKLISKEQVLREMKNRAEDSDIVATSSVMSLKCPLSTLRIQVPCRSVVCTHNQCFDASSFLELQKQAPTWTCPVCTKSTSFESLQVDQYVDEILRSTEVDQVVVEPSGSWSKLDDNDAAKMGGATPATDDDDDLIEISEPSASVVKQEPTSSNILLERTPAQSRETSTPSSVVRMSSKKRPVAQIIDLTGSDDDDGDESPVPPLKRAALGFSARGFSSQDPHQPVASSPLSGRYPQPY
ncbi:transcriptional regulator family: Zinc finger MIZ-type [Penicillium angulare]|uniref:transcriptional regulator family: Zinc finger MIZ-type n=1 Tax=Penicillium angulare TaxID=116970 RepID=UPI00254143C6|nr:transcriptional regulator family: Zinc finger MIZ-type [Penicillium angulare]KAJ5279895.1 transcriptional regulator family: Zinc finger MIZ-type [Penicillium angulare]